MGRGLFQRNLTKMYQQRWAELQLHFRWTFPDRSFPTLHVSQEARQRATTPPSVAPEHIPPSTHLRKQNL